MAFKIKRGRKPYDVKIRSVDSKLVRPKGFVYSHFDHDKKALVYKREKLAGGNG